MSEKDITRAEQERTDLETIARWHDLLGRVWINKQIEEADYWQSVKRVGEIESVLSLLLDKEGL